MKKLLLFCITIFITITGYAQYTGNIWCFGDSAGIRFTNSNPANFSTAVKSRGSCVSICDNNDSLLIYAYTRAGVAGNTTLIKNRFHHLVQDGDNIVGQGWYHELVLLPDPGNDSILYLFSIGVSTSSPIGLFYSTINYKANNDSGVIIQKNIQLQSFNVVDDLTAIKHGNGNDWWLICQRWDGVNTALNNEFYIYKIDSSGISNVTIQNVGTLRNNGGGDLTFNSDGSKLIYANWQGLLELYDFDRCSGTISNPVLIEPRPSQNAPYYMSAVISPNDRYLYLTSYSQVSTDTNHLYQFDLQAANIAASKLEIDTFVRPIGLDHMELAPDHKIYIACADEHFSFPYPDSAHTSVTDNLSVINFPDSGGLACDFQPFSFYLGGRRTYYGLPNNPDYTLGPLVGSPCDTITAVHEIKVEEKNELKLFYQPQWDFAFINADKLKGKNYTLTLYDITGKIIYKESGYLLPPYFTKDVSMQNFAKGIYIVVLQTEKEILKKKFVKY